MKLESLNGASVELAIAGYEFAASRRSRDRWDDNWLTVSGRVIDGDTRWCFREPCLTTSEARDLATWLRKAATSTTAGLPRLEFIEPNVGLRLERRTPEQFSLIFRFSHESLPYDAVGEMLGDVYEVSLHVTRTALIAAADQWKREVAAFPER